MTQKRHRDYIVEAARLGAEVAGFETTGGNHVRLILTSRGKVQPFIIGQSDGDKRAFLNWRARVKRWIKETYQ